MKIFMLFLCVLLILTSCTVPHDHIDSDIRPEFTDSIDTNDIPDEQQEQLNTDNYYSFDIPCVIDKKDYKFLAVQLKDKYNSDEINKPFLVTQLQELENVFGENENYLNGYCDLSYTEKYFFDESSSTSFFEEYFIVGFYVGAKYINNPISVSSDVEFRPYVKKISAEESTITFDITDGFEKPDSEYLILVKLPEKYRVKEYVVAHLFNAHPAPFVELEGYKTDCSVRLYDQADGHVGQFSYNLGAYKNADDVKSFLDSNRMGYSWREPGYDKTAEEICKKYDDRFFEHNILLIVTSYTCADKGISLTSIIYNGYRMIINIENGVKTADRVSDFVVKESCLFIEMPKELYNEPENTYLHDWVNISLD